jgi:hypothetical protein
VGKFTFDDLRRNFELFKNCLSELLNRTVPLTKLFAFAFVKLYLLYYIEIGNPIDDTCVKINDVLRENNPVMENLRFYCLKLLRLKNDVKTLSKKYV